MNQLTWDKYFLRIAKEISSNSKCLSRQIGAVIVRDNAIISTGYNGPARGVKHCNERRYTFYENLDGKILEGSYESKLPMCPRRIFDYKSGKGLHLCQAGHAERNAIIQAARNGISTLGTTIYAYCPLPCKDCSIEIVNSGIKRLVCLEGPEYDGYARTILLEGGIEIKKIISVDLEENNGI